MEPAFRVSPFKDIALTSLRFPTGTPTTTAAAYTGWPAGTDGTIIGGSGTLWTDVSGASGSTGGAGGGQPHFNIQPTTYCNYMIKL